MSQRFDIRRYLSIRSAGSGSFSPDGKNLSFLTNITGVPQIWRVPVESGWPDQLTFYRERILMARYSPSSDEIIFTGDAGGNEREQISLIAGDGSTIRNITHDLNSIHSSPIWSHDGQQLAFSSNRRQPAFMDVYVTAPATSTELEPVLEGEGTFAPVAWRRDNRALLIRRAWTNLNHDLYLLPLDGSGKLEHLTPHEGMATYSYAGFNAGNTRLYVVTDIGREFRGLATIDLATHELEWLDTPSWDIGLMALSRDAGRIAYTVQEGGYSRLVVRELPSFNELPVAELPPGVIEHFAWSPDSTSLAVTLSGSRYNPDVWHCPIAGDQKAARITHASTAGIPQSSFIEPELVHYPTFDGLQIPALYYVPQDAKRDGTLPVIVWVHGGPEGQTVPNFNPVIQYMLYCGYAVFAPNVRGSTGYGRTYVHLDDVRKRMDSVRDLAYAVEWLKTQGGADPKRIAVYGGSYGGFMVLAALTNYPDLWAAGVDLVGIANFETFLENTGAWRRKLREAEYGSLENDREFLREISPIYKVDRITAPLMVVHGANDPRVPVGEAEQIVEQLRERDRPVEYLRFEDEGHGIVKLENRIITYAAIVQFLDRYLK